LVESNGTEIQEVQPLILMYLEKRKIKMLLMEKQTLEINPNNGTEMSRN
jgi:hypothetical protein